LARTEDVDASVPLIYSSGPDAFDYVFWDAESFLRRAYLDGTGECGNRNHTVAVSTLRNAHGRPLTHVGRMHPS
jgi:hypothetical protein